MPKLVHGFFFGLYFLLGEFLYFLYITLHLKWLVQVVEHEPGVTTPLHGSCSEYESRMEE